MFDERRFSRVAAPSDCHCGIWIQGGGERELELSRSSSLCKSEERSGIKEEPWFRKRRGDLYHFERWKKDLSGNRRCFTRTGPRSNAITFSRRRLPYPSQSQHHRKWLKAKPNFPDAPRGAHLEFRAFFGDRQPRSDLTVMARRSGISSSEPGLQPMHPSSRNPSSKLRPYSTNYIYITLTLGRCL